MVKANIVPVGPVVAPADVLNGSPLTPIPGKMQETPQSTKTQLAQFAAGCFWSVELAFQRLPGVLRTAVGYTQGQTKNPSYDDVCSGETNHVEAVLVEYDPVVVSYDHLLETFWKKHDPTTPNAQGNDHGTQYRSGIYFYTPEQQATAEASKKAHQSSYQRPIATEILPATDFYYAEDYHQQYLEKGGRNGRGQSAKKMCNDPIRCYG
eukprot:CAMPEP_0196652386 /NCGR_PEP_ID=MMETSP1086-20130531/1661_1 /TAXON_ID=77921 /ORGANISM="Cyanoptyche  gloeocystis , Strain SAG4.97" /LENGTH=207 /DNA_ID=CAMNT_0041982903 /DNA_START=110 /DNA_END=733 /DNA_ORIENTATION=+